VAPKEKSKQITERVINVLYNLIVLYYSFVIIILFQKKEEI